MKEWLEEIRGAQSAERRAEGMHRQGKLTSRELADAIQGIRQKISDEMPVEVFEARQSDGTLDALLGSVRDHDDRRDSYGVKRDRDAAIRKVVSEELLEGMEYAPMHRIAELAVEHVARHDEALDEAIQSGDAFDIASAAIGSGLEHEESDVDLSDPDTSQEVSDRFAYHDDGVELS